MKAGACPSWQWSKIAQNNISDSKAYTGQTSQGSYFEGITESNKKIGSLGPSCLTFSSNRLYSILHACRDFSLAFLLIECYCLRASTVANNTIAQYFIPQVIYKEAHLTHCYGSRPRPTGWYLVITFLLAPPQGDTGHLLVRDREHACMSFHALLKPQVFGHEAPVEWLYLILIASQGFRPQHQPCCFQSLDASQYGGWSWVSERHAIFQHSRSPKETLQSNCLL